MADHRDPGTGDGDAEAPPSSAAPGAEDAEPEFGSSEWLLRELGTTAEDEAAASTSTSTDDEPDHGARSRRRWRRASAAADGEAEAGAEDVPASRGPVGSPGSSESAAEPSPAGTPVAPPGFTWNLTPGTGEDPLVSAAPATRAAPGSSGAPDAGSGPALDDGPDRGPVLPEVSAPIVPVVPEPPVLPE